jgi:DNA-binding transcriptional LysR family regulator
MPVTLLQLRAFVLSVREGKLSQAADHMGLTQPTVSFHLARLQEEVGQPLFFGDTRRADRLTPTGAALYRYAERMLALEDEVRALIADAGALRRGHVRLGSTHTPATYFLPAVLAGLWQEYPDLRVTLDVAPSHVLLPKLEAYDLDFCCVNHFPPWDSHLVVYPLFRDDLVVVAAPGHPAAARSALTVPALAAYPLIMHEPGSVSRQVADTLFDMHQVRPSILAEVSGTEAMKALVVQGLGVALVSRLACLQEAGAGTLAAIPLEGAQPRHERQICLVERADSERSGESAALRHALALGLAALPAAMQPALPLSPVAPAAP